jgi:hypothetical protein
MLDSSGKGVLKVFFPPTNSVSELHGQKLYMCLVQKKNLIKLKPVLPESTRMYLAIRLLNGNGCKITYGEGDWINAAVRNIPSQVFFLTLSLAIRITQIL